MRIWPLISHQDPRVNHSIHAIFTHVLPLLLFLTFKTIGYIPSQSLRATLTRYNSIILT